MEYAQMMMACGLLVCPADETDIQRAEETNTLISLSDTHSKKCPNARNAQKDNQIHGKIKRRFGLKFHQKITFRHHKQGNVVRLKTKAQNEISR